MVSCGAMAARLTSKQKVAGFSAMGMLLMENDLFCVVHNKLEIAE